MIFKIFKSNIGKNVISNFYGVGVNLFSQIFLVPFFIEYWGVQKYGDWIIFLAITSFFSMSDVGFNTIISNNFSISYTEKKIDDCKKLLINNFFLLFSIFFIVMLISVIFVYTFDLVKILGLHVTSLQDARLIFLLLVLNIFIGMFNGVYNAIYRATSRFHYTVYIDNTARLLEAVILLIGLLTGMSMVNIVILYNLPKVMVFFYKNSDTKKIFPFSFDLQNISLPLLKSIAIPSLSFMSFPLGYTIIQQGFIMLVNRFFGANALVLFNTTRTMSNFLKTILGIVATSIWPEFTLAYGNKDYERMRKIHRKSVKGSFIISLLISLVFVFFGKYIYDIWTHHKLQFNPNLLYAFLVVLMVNNFWYTSSVTLLATNKHIKLGMLFVFSSLFSLIFAYFTNPIFKSLVFVTLSLLFIEVTMSIYTFRNSLIITRDSFKKFIFSKF